MKQNFLGIALLPALLLIAMACGKRPASNSAHLTPGANHTQFTDDCADCHLKDKPAVVAGVDHGFDAPCGACHTYDAVQPWKRLPHTHDPQTSHCAPCHGPRKPNDQTHQNGADCVKCHNTTSWN